MVYCTKKTKKILFLDHWPRNGLSQTSSPDPRIKKPMFCLVQYIIFGQKDVIFKENSCFLDENSVLTYDTFVGGKCRELLKIAKKALKSPTFDQIWT